MTHHGSVVDVTYDDSRTGQRVRERRIQEIPDDEVEEIRQRELAGIGALTLAPRRLDYGQDDYNYDNDYRWQRQVRERSRGHLDADYALSRRRSHRSVARRRSPSPSSSDSDSLSDRHSRRKGHRRARSEQAVPDTKNENDEGIAWYSGKPRKDCNIIERNFDSSYDGLFAAAAGGLIGAMTARRFGGYDHYTEEDRKKNKWKTLGGAAVGAAAFNLAENRYRVYTEEKEERREERREERKARDRS